MIFLQEEHDFLKKKFSSMQDLIELKKQKKVLHALKLEILALADDLDLKIIDPTDEEAKVIEAVEKAIQQLKGQYIEIVVDDNKSDTSKHTLKSQELTEKLQKLQKIYEDEEDRKLEELIISERSSLASAKSSQHSLKDKKAKKSKSENSNSSKKSKKDSKSKEKNSDTKKVTKNKKEWHLSLRSVFITWLYFNILRFIFCKIFMPDLG